MAQDSGLVLIVDDDEQIREAMRDSLELEGYLTAEAGDGGEALAYLMSGARPGIILLDWNMAPMNALEFMDAYGKMEVAGAIPVVLVTADAQAPRKATQAPFAGYLKKPVRLETLVQTIARLTQ